MQGKLYDGHTPISTVHDETTVPFDPDCAVPGLPGGISAGTPLAGSGVSGGMSVALGRLSVW